MKLAPCAALGSDNNEHYWLWSCELSLFYGSKAVVYCLVWLIMHFVKVDQMVGLMLDQVFYQNVLSFMPISLCTIRLGQINNEY
jgi:hypothetical protein